MTMKPGQRFIPYKMFNGIFIPNVLLESALLSPAEMIVYGRLCQFGGEKGFCYPSLSTIATKTSISRSGTIKSINSLVESGFIEKQVPDMVSMGQQCTNQYYFLLHPVFWDAFRTPSPQSGLPLVQSVDQPSLQSRPKEIYKENHKKTTTTTTTSSEGINGAGGLGRGCGFSLSEDQKHYIALKVKWTVFKGKITESSEALKRFLVRKAKSGELDMSDYADLKLWDEMQHAQDHESGDVTQRYMQDKEKLLDEQAKKSEEAQQWLNGLPEDHPAKQRTTPQYIPKDVWIRQLRAEFSDIGPESSK